MIIDNLLRLLRFKKSGGNGCDKLLLFLGYAHIDALAGASAILLATRSGGFLAGKLPWRGRGGLVTGKVLVAGAMC